MAVKDDDLRSFELYTDGACQGNPGPGGWGYIVRGPDGSEQEASGGEASTTNNRMELLSVINGLKSLRDPAIVDLYSDSQYVVNGLREWIDGWKARGWRRPGGAVKNLELWQELDRLRAFHRIRAHWIRGHNEHPENERCDRLAVAAIASFQRGVHRPASPPPR